MFVHKYRVHSFEKIIGLPKNLPEIGVGMPHLFLYGRPGTGKSLLSEAVVKKLSWESLRLNCSDFRGIDVGRDIVKPYMMTMSVDGNPKILMLEEFDAVTLDFQKLLRQYLEDYAKNCIVIVTLNYPNKIIEPLKSRFVRINMDKKDKVDIQKHLINICDTEKIEFENEAIDLIVNNFYPDIRAMINKLEEFKGKKITKDLITLDEDKVADLLNLIKEKNFTKARLWCLNSSWSHSEILKQLYKYGLKTELEPSKKLKFIESLAEGDFRLGMSTDPEVQTSATLVRLIRSLI